MKQTLLIPLLAFTIVTGILGSMIIHMALQSRPVLATHELIDTLPQSERLALATVCAAAEIDPASLRSLPVVLPNLFRAHSNARSIVIRDGHVRALCLANSRFMTAPDFSAFTEIESLWLESCGLTEWPALANLTCLIHLEVNDQPLPSIPQNVLPPNLQVLGLSRTKVSDISWLAHLSALRELDLTYSPITNMESIRSLKLQNLRSSDSAGGVPTS
jgi:Leucine Rich repeats (2 copies)